MKSMKIITVACFAALCLYGFAAGQNVSVTDYNVAVSTARVLHVNANYNMAMQGDSTTVDKGTGTIAIKRYYNSLPFAWNYDGTGSITEVDGNVTALLDLSTRVKKFFNDETDYFGGVQVDMGYSTEYDVLGRDEPRTDVTAIAGYGRFIDATPLAKAVRIEAFLIEEGILSDHMPKGIILEVANTIEKEQEYKDKYGATYKSQWYNAMEEVMAGSGLLKNNSLGGLGTLRIEEVLFEENVHNRFYGYDVTAGVGITATTPDTNANRGDGVATLGFRWARPVAWKTQLEQSFQLNTPLKSSFGKSINAKLTTTYVYELTNRIDFAASHILDFTKVDIDNVEGVDDQTFNNAANFAFLFYIENYINWKVDLGFNKLEGSDLLTTLHTGISLNIW